MFLFEVLMSLFAQLVIVVGGVGAFLIVGVAVVLAVLCVRFLAHWLADSFLGMSGRSASPTSFDHFGRRIDPLARDRKQQAKIAQRLEAMDVATLRAWTQKHPHDSVASLLLCERLKGRGDLEGYAQERERYLTIDETLTVSEKATQYHQLADLYLGPIARPARACEILRAFLENYPDSGEACLTRERLRRIEAIEDAQKAAPDAPFSMPPDLDPPDPQAEGSTGKRLDP